ncbi:MAG TPA: ABC transporter ATP-binding protein [Firmicutes bacterium]|nr:ABC transporter ATP-binding protein [Bacillota bacterium]
MALLSVDNLTKIYKGQLTTAVSDVSFEVNEGEIVAFVGPNGAGKSTTIKCITGIHPFDGGSVVVCGHDIKTDPIGAKMNIGYVSDDHATYENLTGYDYLNFVCNVYRVPAGERKQKIQNLADMLEISSALSKQINTYSHGMKQKICIIAALVHSPKLWILDEPMTGLDPRSAHILKELMRSHCAEGNSVFFSSHVLEVVEKLCDRVVIINRGSIIKTLSEDDLKEITQSSSLEEYFLTLTGGAVSETKDGE